MSVDHPELHGAAAAGLLAGILADWKASANPGALDDMVQSPTEYAFDTAAVTLAFADGSTFVVMCLCTFEPGSPDE